MVTNHLLTGPPKSGKTTTLRQTVARLEDAGVTVGGFYSPERRRNGERVGFDLVEVGAEERATLAAVDRERGPTVGKYRVAVDAVDKLAGRALPDARATADLIAIDEIATMQLHSDVFLDELELTLESDRPVLAAVQSDSSVEFVDRIKQRRDVRLYRVTPETRDELPERLATRFRNAL